MNNLASPIGDVPEVNNRRAGMEYLILNMAAAGVEYLTSPTSCLVGQFPMVMGTSAAACDGL